MSTAKSETVQWALRYASLGWPVFPVQRDAKVPANGHGFKGATTDSAAIACTWPEGSKLNIGAAIPDGIVVVDIDSQEAMQTLGALDLELPTTATQRTPRGGWHLLYRLPDGVTVRQTAGEIAPGVDTRTAGKGYICVAPSCVNGSGYSWETPPKPETIAEAPEWIVDKLAEKGNTYGSAPPTDEEIPAGRRNSDLASLAGTMRRRGMEASEIAAAIQAVNLRRCRPPLSDREVEDIAKSVSRYKPTDQAKGTEPPRREGQKAFRSLADLLSQPELLDPPKPVAPRIAFKGRVSLLAAREKDGKSTLAGAAAAAASRGGEFLEGEAEPGLVVWCALEEAAADVVTRLMRFGADPEQVLVGNLMANPLAEIEAAVKEHRPSLVVIDTLAALADGVVQEANSSSAWTPLMLRLSRLAQETGAAILLLHHARKSDGSYRDSSAIGAGVDLILELRPNSADPSVRHLKAKGRFSVPDSSLRFDGTAFTLTSGQLSLDARVLLFVENNPGCSLRRVRQGVAGRNGEIDAAIDRLILRNAIEDRGCPYRSNLNTDSDRK